MFDEIFYKEMEGRVVGSRNGATHWLRPRGRRRRSVKSLIDWWVSGWRVELIGFIIT